MYYLDNVENRSNEFKYTFSLPSKEQIKNLRPGELVKLIFTEDGISERMWVKITDIMIDDVDNCNRDNSSNNNNSCNNSDSEHVIQFEDHKDINQIENYRFFGNLDNKPFTLKSIVLGDKVEFHYYNILSIFNQSNQCTPIVGGLPSELKQMLDQRCLVSNLVASDKQPAGYIFREDPTFHLDSGWRIFQGDESDEYMKDRTNFQTIALGSVLNIDDSILPILSSPPDHYYEYDTKSRQWKELVN
ncbi:hypothetical protein CYY_006357 [Polysphondylium violaceum]|uniref:Immunity protein Imm33 domain-containing protein n=1 Tax=Polysphondylium violaceum TaxID=133409 RepID=A0A8J4PRH6_9MYCE|nr:hypothetical protein CYY_006357 [Polysphondylium violaceum]